tara:strand:+ start:3299 stop:3463 length:165 start_codon:yes stop_codon:yes gene_type:complete
MRAILSRFGRDADRFTPRRASDPLPALIVGACLLLAIAWAIAPAVQAVIEVAAR